MLYDRPDEPARLECEAYVRALIIKGERNQESAHREGPALFEKARGQGQPRSMTATCRRIRRRQIRIVEIN
jgi:hypothetical protein